MSFLPSYLCGCKVYHPQNPPGLHVKCIIITHVTWMAYMLLMWMHFLLLQNDMQFDDFLMPSSKIYSVGTRSYCIHASVSSGIVALLKVFVQRDQHTRRSRLPTFSTWTHSMRAMHDTEYVLRIRTATPCTTYTYATSISASAHITIPSVLPQIRHKRDATFLGFQVVVCRWLCEAATERHFHTNCSTIRGVTFRRECKLNNT